MREKSPNALKKNLCETDTLVTEDQETHNFTY